MAKIIHGAKWPAMPNTQALKRAMWTGRDACVPTTGALVPLSCKDS